MSDVTKNNKNTDDALVEENRLLGIRLSASRGFVKMLMIAYDALLHHGVNYRELKSYKDSELLDSAMKSGSEAGRVKILDWIERVCTDIRAAVARKNFKQV